MFQEAETWFSMDLPKFRDLIQYNRTHFQQRIKVAIFDTGIDRNDVFMKRFLPHNEAGFIENYCWAYPNSLHPLEDKNGHGTRCASLLLRTAPDIELFVVRIMNDDGKMDKVDDDDDDYEGIFKVSLSTIRRG